MKDIINRQIVKGLCASAITCECGAILDCDSCLAVERQGKNLVFCRSCFELLNRQRPNWRSNFEKAGTIILAEPKPPSDDEPLILRYRAFNAQSGLERIVEVPEELARDIIFDSVSPCSGRCEHEIEPDGICEEGWPAIAELIATGQDID